MAKQNKILRVALSGGIIGALTTNPRKALEKNIAKENENGWVATHVQVHGTTNLLIMLLQGIVLCCTAFLWTFGGGYLVLLEKDIPAQ